MKKLLILFIAFVYANSAYAQFNVNDGIYSSFELNMGNYLGIDMNLNYVFDQKYSLKLGYNFQIGPPDSQPDDFKMGVLNFMVLGLANPYDKLSTYKAEFGQLIDLNNNKTFRLNFSMGLGYSNVIEPTNWRKLDNGVIGDVIAHNYNWDYKVIPTMSIIINPKFEYVKNNFIGLSLSPMIIINKYTAYYGIGAGLLLGSIKGQIPN